MARGVAVSAWTRDRAQAAALASRGITPHVAATPEALDDSVLAESEALLDSVPLERDAGGWHAPQLRWVSALVRRMPRLSWVGYLSSSSVYADSGGQWIDEDAPLERDGRGRQRLRAEQAWRDSGAPVECFRLSGIYGPGRNLIARLRKGGYRAVSWQPPRYSNRIHRDDIVATLLAGLSRPRAGRVLNVSDDEPLPHVEYVTRLAEMVSAPQPLRMTPEEARAHCSDDYLAFFRANKRISNRRLHHELLPRLRYPSFRDAVPELLESL